MSRIYAGVLGLLAFLISLLRGMLHGYGTDSVLATACGSTLLLATVGLAIGPVDRRGLGQQPPGGGSGGPASRRADAAGSPQGGCLTPRGEEDTEKDFV